MPTIKELIEDVHADKNAVSAARKGLEAVRAFVGDAKNKFERGANAEGLEVMTSIAHLVEQLIHAVPANVTPASAGPIGKSPHEQYLEQAAGVVNESLTKLSEVVTGVHAMLKNVDEALGHLNHASAAIKSPDLRKAS